MASLTREPGKAQGNRYGRSTLCEGHRVQARGVIQVRPETRRSIREQGEAWRKPRGGPLEVVSYNILS